MLSTTKIPIFLSRITHRKWKLKTLVGLLVCISQHLIVCNSCLTLPHSQKFCVTRIWNIFSVSWQQSHAVEPHTLWFLSLVAGWLCVNTSFPVLSEPFRMQAATANIKWDFICCSYLCSPPNPSGCCCFSHGGMLRGWWPTSQDWRLRGTQGSCSAQQLCWS